MTRILPLTISIESFSSHSLAESSVMPDSPSILFLPGDRSNKTLLGCIVRSKKITQQNGKEKKKRRRIFFSGVYTRRERAKKKESIFRSGIIRRGDVARCSTANNLRTKNCKKVEKDGLFLFFFPFFILFLQETKTRFVFREKRKIVVKLINGEGIEIFHEKRGFDCTRCNGLNALSKFISVSHFYVSFSRRKICGLI